MQGDPALTGPLLIVKLTAEPLSILVKACKSAAYWESTAE